MNGVAPADYAAMATLLVMGFFASVFQMLRVCREFSGGRRVPAEILLDLGILVHLVTFCLVFRCFEEGSARLVLNAGLAVSAIDLAWANLLPSAIALVCAWKTGKPRVLLVLVPLVATLPPLAPLYGRAWVLVCALDLVFFSVRLAVPYLNGRKWGGEGISAASPSEVLNLLGHGVLCASASGQVILMNTAMRDILAGLGLETDLSDARAMFLALAPEPPGTQRGVRLDDGRAFLVSVDDGHLESRALRFAIAYDVSEEYALNHELEQANADLQEQNRELARLVRNIVFSAMREADLEMRGAVHDIVGQRLSILHRHLEDGDLDDETIGEMRTLLADLSEDLRPASKVSPEAELSALVDAFGKAGIEVDLSGELASDEDTARLEVRVVREALTNALRHGNARKVWIAFGLAAGSDDAGPFASVEVVNDGERCAGDIIEGNGLSGLRRAVEGAGGVFSVEGSPRFRVRAELPFAQEGR